MVARKKVKISKKIVCVDCEGTGSMDKKSYECSDCHGTGACEIVRQMGFAMIRQQVTCPSCRGQGECVPPGKTCMGCSGNKLVSSEETLNVSVEKGMSEGEDIIFRGKSHEAPGYISGDVRFVIQEQKHAIFDRKGDNLVIIKTIPLVNALTGFSFSLTHLDGKELFISTPPNLIISPGMQLEVPNEGLPRRKWISERGTLFVRFNIDFPVTLNSSQINSLNSCLPDRILPLDTPSGSSKVELQPVDEDRMDENDHRHGQGYGGAYDSSSGDDDEGGAVPCAQQ
jgi:DnaJ family protein A protein 2